ncbi:DUF6236 family protein [Actibacterium lipolyticum]|uniref:Uncharacterized protein n=1 Tax=Actibacterium lipolyticum TaxID=1524263 RepID=A0A238JNP8_9RHOB|nr:DUF6236 family protein [Actibacterium lipolyticum]SMX32271.1 hypothetical protein COL8621_00767 [Actibacterium lipolyticum]
MGEAKRRKQTDPLYGKMPKAGRGLVISNPVSVAGDSLTTKGMMDPTELRRAVLFWDRIAYPKNNLAEGGESHPDIKFLVKEKMLTLSPGKVTKNANTLGHLIAEGHIKTFLKRESGEPGLWCMSEGPYSMLLKDQHFSVGKGVLMELYRAIPIPTEDAKLDDVLEFKRKRSDEVRLLSYEIDQMFHKIAAADNKAAALELHKNEIEKRCANVMKVAKEAKLPFKLSDWKINFSVKSESGNMIDDGSLGAQLGSQNALPELEALVGGTSTLKISAGTGFYIRGRKTQLAPYRVVTRLHNEVI